MAKLKVLMKCFPYFMDDYNINVILNLLNNFNFCLNYNFHFKGAKRNALSNVIDFNFASCINNVYIYFWYFSLNAFD